MVTTGQQREQRDGTAVTVVDLASGRPAGQAANGTSSRIATVPAGPASQASASPASGDQAAPAITGVNPCGAVISQAGAGPVPVRANFKPDRLAPPSPAASSPA